MIILGAHFGHDGAVCIVENGRLISALASERLSRAKKTHGIRDADIDAVLQAANLTSNDIDAVALSDYHSQYVHGTMEVFLKGADEVLGDSWNSVFDNDIWEMDVKFRGRTIPGFNVGHHMSHMAAAFYTSPFDDAWCMSTDSSGGYTKTNFGWARGNLKTLNAQTDLSLLIGLAYGEACEKLHLGSQMFKAGAMMALAAYGTPYPHVVAMADEIYDKSMFEHPSGDYRAWVEVLWNIVSQGYVFSPETKDSAYAMDVAASYQYIFEHCILRFLNAQDAGGCYNLCLGGGSFLNCNANSRVLNDSQFGDVHLFPAASDDGCAIGAALYTAHHIFGQKRRPYTDSEICYLGPKWSKQLEPNYEIIVDALVNGKVVAWYQGRSEQGPRALGNRSLLADPRNPGMRNHINSQIKNREWFRPLSPSVLEEDCAEWFEFAGQSPFMLFTAKAKHPEKIPAVVHVDGSSRMQTVTEELNPHYYRLIKRFKEITGVPMLLNTSLNMNDEPIHETEADTRRMWNERPIDMMVINGVITSR